MRKTAINLDEKQITARTAEKEIRKKDKNR